MRSLSVRPHGSPAAVRKYTTVEAERLVVTVNKALELSMVPKALLTRQLKRLPESLGCTWSMEYAELVAPTMKEPSRRQKQTRGGLPVAVRLNDA